MYYSEEEARNLVIKAGLRLVETGLIARTWGNISARISADEFIITPSGRAYETLKPEDLVKIKARDLSYDGDIKPSSEKGVHAVAYILRPEISFVIHTHQFYASVISITGKDTNFAAAAAYGLPGTDKLKSKVMQAISKNPSKTAFLLTKHGALCLGRDYDDAFEVANNLELESKKLFEAAVNSTDYITDYKALGKNLLPYIDDFAQIIGTYADMSKDIDEICNGEDAEAQRMIFEKNCAAALYAKKTGARPLGFADAKLQRIVYLKKYSKLKV